jgi:hypothetical protein
MTVRGDEAYWLLRVVDLLSSTMKLPMYASVAAIVVGQLLGALRDVVRLPGLIYSPLWNLGNTMEAASVPITLGGIALYLTSLVFMFLVLPLIRGHVLSYGERPWDSLLFNIRVKPFPPGGSPSTLFIPIQSRSGLRHSALYSDASVIANISEWLRERIEEESFRS